MVGGERNKHKSGEMIVDKRAEEAQINTWVEIDARAKNKRTTKS